MSAPEEVPEDVRRVLNGNWSAEEEATLLAAYERGQGPTGKILAVATRAVELAAARAGTMTAGQTDAALRAVRDTLEDSPETRHVDDICQHIAALGARNATLEASNARATEALVIIGAEVGAREGEPTPAAVRRALAEERARVRALGAQTAEAERLLRGASKAMGDRMSEIDSLRSELARLESEKATYEKGVDALSAVVEKDQERLEQLRAEVARLKPTGQVAEDYAKLDQILRSIAPPCPDICDCAAHLALCGLVMAAQGRELRKALVQAEESQKAYAILRDEIGKRGAECAGAGMVSIINGIDRLMARARIEGRLAGLKEALSDIAYAARKAEPGSVAASLLVLAHDATQARVEAPHDDEDGALESLPPGIPACEPGLPSEVGSQSTPPRRTMRMPSSYLKITEHKRVVPMDLDIIRLEPAAAYALGLPVDPLPHDHGTMLEVSRIGDMYRRWMCTGCPADAGLLRGSFHEIPLTFTLPPRWCSS